MDSERPGSDDARRQAQARHVALFDNMSEGYAHCRMVYDRGQALDFLFLAINPAFDRLLRIGDVVGNYATDVLPGIRTSNPGLIERCGMVASTGRSEFIETHIAALGEWLSISVHCPAAGEFVWLFQVITERKRIEEERERLATALEQSGETIVITDTHGLIKYVNPAFEATTGYTRAEVLGCNPSVLKSGRQDPAFYRELWSTITSGRVWQGRFVNRRKDGALFVEDATVSPVRDSSGVIAHYVAVKRNVTREIDLEAQLMQAQKLESVGRLAGGVAHDFNNMLCVILGHVDDALGSSGLAAPLRESLKEIREAARRSADLTRQLLAFGRQQVASPRVINLNDTVTGLLKMLRRLLGEHISLTCTLGSDLWAVKIDPTQVDQILANLLVNARDAINGIGRIVITTMNVNVGETFRPAHPGLVEGPYVGLAVIDNGRGMPEDVIEHIFDPFFTTKGAGLGTGLGLSTVHGIVAQNGGFIEVDSKPGEGTTFKIYLPKSVERVEGSDLPDLKEVQRGRGETVLIVEDQEALLRMCQTMVSRLGYTALAAPTPGLALEIARRHPSTIDLLLTDVIMPEMNGPDLAKSLAESRPEMRCLYMSGYSSGLIADHGVLDPGPALLPKPYSFRDLASKMRQVLDAPTGVTKPPGVTIVPVETCGRRASPTHDQERNGHRT